MADVKLEPGKPRIGTLWTNRTDDGRPAMVEDTGEAIRVVLQVEHDDPLARRLVGRGARWGDDPDYELHDYSFPDEVWFRDSHGDLCLVHPHTRQFSFGAVQEGRVEFRFALASGDEGISYTQINGLHSQVEGLGEWLGRGCISIEHRATADGRVQEMVVLDRGEAMPFARALNARLQPTYSYRISPIPGESEVNDRVIIETNAQRPRPWADHLDLHRAVRDLIVVAGWQNYGLWGLKASRIDDPVIALARNPLAERWAEVRTYEVTAPTGNWGRSRFLFRFDDIGERGLRRWVTLRARHRRGFAGMIHSIGIPGVALETALSEAGAALEHLGYEIAVARKEPPGQHLATHLKRITSQLRCGIGFDAERWADDFAVVYNTVKHPDRPQVLTTLELANALRQARLVFRVWVARRLGVSRAAVEQNLALVPMHRPYDDL